MVHGVGWILAADAFIVVAVYELGTDLFSMRSYFGRAGFYKSQIHGLNDTYFC